MAPPGQGDRRHDRIKHPNFKVDRKVVVDRFSTLPLDDPADGRSLPVELPPLSHLAPPLPRSGGFFLFGPRKWNAPQQTCLSWPLRMGSRCGAAKRNPCGKRPCQVSSIAFPICWQRAIWFWFQRLTVPGRCGQRARPAMFTWRPLDDAAAHAGLLKFPLRGVAGRPPSG
jgi:hypothetical protein